MADTKAKILIVEDDLDVAEMLNAYFRVQGYEVFTVNWGEDGVRAAQTVLPDLVILILTVTKWHAMCGVTAELTKFRLFF